MICSCSVVISCHLQLICNDLQYSGRPNITVSRTERHKCTNIVTSDPVSYPDGIQAELCPECLHFCGIRATYGDSNF